MKFLTTFKINKGFDRWLKLVDELQPYMEKYEYVTFQTYFLSLLVDGKDERYFTHTSNIPSQFHRHILWRKRGIIK